MSDRQHWDSIYAGQAPESVSWHQAHADRSVALIRATGLSPAASIIDVGSGASRLIDDLLDAGFEHLTALDISAAALASTRARIGSRGQDMHWIEGDITGVPLPHHAYDLWHDRAVFHFLTAPEQRRAYVAAVTHALKPGGHLIVATFAEDGPEKCSGLPVRRYAPAALHAEFGPAFRLLHSERETHVTPAGTAQKFIYCCMQKQADLAS